MIYEEKKVVTFCHGLPLKRLDYKEIKEKATIRKFLIALNEGSRQVSRDEVVL